VRSRIGSNRLPEVTQEDLPISVESGMVHGVQQHPEGVRGVHPSTDDLALGLDRPFQAALNADGLDACLKEARRRSFKKALEEPLDCGEWSGHKAAESSSRPCGPRMTYWCGQGPSA
jgi:hypothetical protein